jgi:predicted NAD/FAD-binding protein
VDSGFVVYNHATYPNFVRLLQKLGVAGRPSDMSFGVRCRSCGLEYSSRGVGGVFAQPGRALEPSHWRMLADIPRFGRRAREFLRGPAQNGAGGWSMDEFLAQAHSSSAFVRHFLLPMGGAIWSAPRAEIRAFPAKSFLSFFENHGWLTLDGAHQWWTVEGGSRAYVDAISRPFAASIHLRLPVESVTRDTEGVEVRAAGGYRRRFHKVVLATHADQSLRLLADRSSAEEKLLGAFRYSHNTAVLHTDRRTLPEKPGAWASWNCEIADCREETPPVSLTYHMNRLQSLPGPDPVLVSLNRTAAETTGVLARMDYEHPVLDAAATAAQADLRGLSGQRHTFFAGAHLGYGFHEDGLNSALAVASQFGIAL